jgi:hypothetical protein
LFFVRATAPLAVLMAAWAEEASEPDVAAKVSV